MPRKPDWSQHVPDPRFDPYRNQVARLFRGSEEIGLLLVRVELVATRQSGHLWWTRWSPSREVLWLETIVDGDYSDGFVDDDGFKDEWLRRLQAGQCLHYGEVLLTQWTPEAEAAHLRRSQFGVEDEP